MSRNPDGPPSPQSKSVVPDDAKLPTSFEPLAGHDWPERVRIVALCFASFVLCNCDRINISVAILPMASTYGWSQSTVGIIQSSFFWGYVTTQIPGGYLSDRYGGRRVLAFGVVAWSLMTVLTPAAASTSLPMLLASRALLGIGEGVAMPAMNQVLSRWVPRGERSKSLSLVYSGMYLGSTIGLLCCPVLIANFGWQSVFYFFGGFGGLWWLAWTTFTSETPQSSTTISPSELEFIERNTAATRLRPLESIPWRMLLSEKATWAIIVAHFCCTWGYFVLLTWLPTYFSTQLGFDLRASAFASVIPWVAMFIFANVGGLLADRLLAEGLSMTNVRKLMQTIGFMGPAIFLGLVSVTEEPISAVIYMTLALALGSFSQSGVYANHQDIGPNYAGILLGMSNTAASLPGIVGVALTGILTDIILMMIAPGMGFLLYTLGVGESRVILDLTGSWDLVFGIAIGFYIVGTVVYNAFATGERVFD